MPNGTSETSRPSPLDLKKALQKPVETTTTAILHDRGDRPRPPGMEELTPQSLFTEFAKTTPEHPANPETREIMKQFGERFQHMAGYVTSRLGGITEGRPREIAEQFAHDLHEVSVTLGIDPQVSYDQTILNPEEEQEIDRLLSGETLYQKRLQRLETRIAHEREAHPQPSEGEQTLRESALREDMRQHTLDQFFRTVARSGQEVMPENPQTEEPAPTSFREAFRERVQGNFDSFLEYHALATLAVDIFSQETRRLANEIHMPEVMSHSRDEITEGIIKQKESAKTLESEPEMSALKQQLLGRLIAIYERALNTKGDERLLRNIIGMDGEHGLIQYISQARATGDPEEVAQAEFISAYLIQNAVGLLPLEKNRNFDGDLRQTRERSMVNCVGISNLMASFLTELQIPHKILLAPGHAILALTYTTSDAVILIEPQSVVGLHSVTNSDFTRDDGTNISQIELHETIISSNSSLALNAQSDETKTMIRDERDSRVYLYPSTTGITLGILNNISVDTSSLDPEQRLAIALLFYSIAPEDGSNLNNIGASSFALQRYESSLAAYQSAVRTNPSDYIAYRNLGINYVTLDQYDEAIIAFQTALRVNPELELSAVDYDHIGYAYYKLQRYDEALIAYKELLRLRPDGVNTLYSIGNIHEAQNNIAEAITAYREYIARAKLLPEEEQQEIKDYLSGAQRYIDEHQTQNS